MTPKTQTGAYQKIRPDHHAPVESPSGLDGRAMGGTDRGEHHNHSTQPTNPTDTHTPATRHHTKQTLIALTPTEAAEVLAIAMRDPKRDDLPILEHLAFLLDRANNTTTPHQPNNTEPTHRTDPD
jgi:hypothetical protein